jgi:hypothetical protein
MASCIIRTHKSSFVIRFILYRDLRQAGGSRIYRVLGLLLRLGLRGIDTCSFHTLHKGTTVVQY